MNQVIQHHTYLIVNITGAVKEKISSTNRDQERSKLVLKVTSKG